jgi:hypothetical protein
MRSSLIILASIGSLVASSAAFAAAPNAAYPVKPAVISAQSPAKATPAAYTTPDKATHKMHKKVHKVSVKLKKNHKPQVMTKHM